MTHPHRFYVYGTLFKHLPVTSQQRNILFSTSLPPLKKESKQARLPPFGVSLALHTKDDQLTENQAHDPRTTKRSRGSECTSRKEKKMDIDR